MNHVNSVLDSAIIGIGNIAGGYDQKLLAGSKEVFTHAGAYKSNNKWNLKSVFDIDPNLAKVFKNRWGVEKQINSLDELCKCFHDVISICTPDSTHFPILKKILLSGCCKSVFLEKPAAEKPEEIKELISLSKESGINVVLNFQRRFDKKLLEQKEILKGEKNYLLGGNAYYIKGLSHIGTTLIDTLHMFMGFPLQISAYHRVFNNQVNEYSYCFVMYYKDFIINVQSPDSKLFDYHYHIFEIDMLYSDKRITLIDNGKKIRVNELNNFSYSGVKVLNDSNPKIIETDFGTSMTDIVDYVYKITTGESEHNINTLNHAYNLKYIINCIESSYDSQKIVEVEESKCLR